MSQHVVIHSINEEGVWYLFSALGMTSVEVWVNAPIGVQVHMVWVSIVQKVSNKSINQSFDCLQKEGHGMTYLILGGEAICSASKRRSFW